MHDFINFHKNFGEFKNIDFRIQRRIDGIEKKISLFVRFVLRMLKFNVHSANLKVQGFKNLRI